jgi:tetratricopeptide (TPR) repeat protein
LDDQRRREYAQELEKPPAAALSPKKAEIEILEKQADLALKKKELAQAAELFGRAFALSNNQAHAAQQAWAVYLDPAQKEHIFEVKEALAHSLRIDPACDRAAYALGVIARIEEDLDLAEKHFRTAVRANPKNVEAATELRLIEMRRKRGAGKKGGLFT